MAFIVYLASARLGYRLALPNGVVALWPPSGVMLGLFLVMTRRDWLPLAIGAGVGSFVSYIILGRPVGFATVASIANLSESLAAAWLIARRLDLPVKLTTLRAVLEFGWRGPIVTNAVTASFGAAAVHYWLHVPVSKAGIVWWAGHGLGMIVVAPMLLVWTKSRRWWRTLTPARMAEVVVLLLSLVGVALVTLGSRDPRIPGPYMVFPVLFWAALRFGPRGAATAVLIVGGIATWYAAMSTGPFVPPHTSGIQVTALLYMYLGFASLSSLIPACVVEESMESRERYRGVVNAASDVILTINEDSRIEFANAAAEQVLGYPPAELIGRDLTSLMPLEFRERHKAGLARYLSTGERNIPWRGIALPGVHRDGRRVDLEVSFGELTLGGRRLFTGILRDISEKRTLEAQVVQSQKMEALGQLAGGIAHDFNNLLTAIHGYCALVMEEVKPGAAMHDDLSEIMRATKRAESLTAQLLTFSRRQIVAPRVIDLAHAVRQVEPMLRRLIGEHIQVVVRAESDAGHVRADPGQIEQVILNLAVNARDAMPEGGVLSLTVSADHDDEVMLEVRDSGTGMDATVLTHVFEPFFTTKPQGKGTGLGLATVDGIVKQSGGRIAVESVPGQGSTFRIHLPRVDAEVNVDEIAAVSSSVRPSATVLVAEDDDVLRQLVTRVLEGEGYTVLSARRPTEVIAIERTFGGAIHLLLTDVVMPEMNGRMLATAIMARRPDIRVVYMSGYTDDEVVKQSIFESEVEFLQKPFDPETLRRRVAEVLDG
jgi:PAS domain S-box-containing protein